MPPIRSKFFRSTREAFAVDRACAIERFKPSATTRARYWLASLSWSDIATAATVGAAGAAVLVAAACGGWAP